MTDTEVMAEGWGDEGMEGVEVDDDRDLFHDIYVQTATNTLYEVHMFDTFCLVRLASPNFYADIRKLSHIDFSREFHEYGGDPEAVKDQLRSNSVDFLIV